MAQFEISHIIIFVVSIQFLASLTRSTFGFGDALVAMPLLTLVIGVKWATPLVALTALVNASMILSDSWRTADFRSARNLLVGAVFGIPLGLYALKHAPENLVKGALGIVLIGFAIYNLAKPPLIQLKSERWAFPFGFTAGLLGGAYNTNGPPVVMYGVLKRWPPKRFRATLQGYFLPANILVVTGHGIGGLWNSTIWQFFFYSLPLVLLAIFIGRKINRRFSADRFAKFLYVILIFLGMLLLW